MKRRLFEMSHLLMFPTKLPLSFEVCVFLYCQQIHEKIKIFLLFVSPEYLMDLSAGCVSYHRR